MNITEKSFVGLTYALTVDGKLADQALAERPLQFVYGIGMLLPEFEKNILGKKVGDKFKFTLSPENGYGVTNPDAIVELPKEIFMVDGEVVAEATTIGAQLPMGDNQGNKMMGTVTAVGEETITMDFNHPMAGKTLNFEGEVVSVRESTDEDLAQFMGGASGCGCGDGCDCGDDCDCDSEKKCSDGCNC